MEFTTYGDMLTARRWLITGSNKEPQQGWIHPRVMTANGRQHAKMALSTKNGGLMCTGSTADTWLTYAEAVAICMANADKGWVPAFVHRPEDDLVFLDGDWHPHPDGNERHVYERWMDKILGGLRGHQARVGCLPSKNMGHHILFRLSAEDKQHQFPKVKLPCPCGVADCEDGGKVENWIGSKSRYRIQPWDLPDGMAEIEIPFLTYEGLKGIPEFTAAYEEAEKQANLSSELPARPEYIMSPLGGAIRIAEYLQSVGLLSAILKPPEVGYWFSLGAGPWVEFGDNIDSLTLHRRAGERAVEMLEEEAVTPKVRADFKAYINKQLAPSNLKIVKACLLSGMQEWEWQERYAPLQLLRQDFNQRTTDYLHVDGRGVVALREGGRLLGAAEITRVKMTLDAPRISHPDESSYTDEEVDFARHLVDEFIEKGWTDEKLALILYHARPHKGSFFCVGERDTGKSMLFQQMELLGLAGLFPWSDPNAPRYRRPGDKFGTYPETRTKTRLVVFDELTGIRGLHDTSKDTSEELVDSQLLKEQQGLMWTTYERKGEQRVKRAVTSGLGFLSNAAPAIPVEADVYAKTDTQFLYAAGQVEAIAELEKGFARSVLLSPPALNRVAEHILRVWGEVALMARAPMTAALQADDVEIANLCQQSYENRKRKGEDGE